MMMTEMKWPSWPGWPELPLLLLFVAVVTIVTFLLLASPGVREDVEDAPDGRELQSETNGGTGA